MNNKVISYKIDNVVNKVIVEKKIENSLLKDLTFLESDKKILFIYDENIDNIRGFTISNTASNPNSNLF